MGGGGGAKGRMMSERRKHEIITFKVDPDLYEALRGIENRSEFIRNALLNALGGTCPLCKGTGVLTTCQRGHWERFAAAHPLELCADCATVHLVCEVDKP